MCTGGHVSKSQNIQVLAGGRQPYISVSTWKGRDGAHHLWEHKDTNRLCSSSPSHPNGQQNRFFKIKHVLKISVLFIYDFAAPVICRTLLWPTWHILMSYTMSGLFILQFKKTCLGLRTRRLESSTATAAKWIVTVPQLVLETVHLVFNLTFRDLWNVQCWSGRMFQFSKKFKVLSSAI